MEMPQIFPFTQHEFLRFQHFKRKLSAWLDPKIREYARRQRPGSPNRLRTLGDAMEFFMTDMPRTLHVEQGLHDTNRHHRLRQTLSDYDEIMQNSTSHMRIHQDLGPVTLDIGLEFYATHVLIFFYVDKGIDDVILLGGKNTLDWDTPHIHDITAPWWIYANAYPSRRALKWALIRMFPRVFDSDIVPRNVPLPAATNVSFSSIMTNAMNTNNNLSSPIRSPNGLRHFRFDKAKINLRNKLPSSWINPVTLKRVPPKHAYYIKKDVHQNTIMAVYNYSTLATLLRRTGQGVSPLTRKRFTVNDIYKVVTPEHRLGIHALQRLALKQATTTQKKRRPLRLSNIDKRAKK